MTNDKTGAPTTVTAHHRRFTIAVDGVRAGQAAFADRGDQRVFFHTEVDPSFEGRGLGSILVGAALSATHDAGHRIVPVCPIVAAYVGKHPEYNDVVDEPTPELMEWLKNQLPG